jgi:DNA-binding IclR family transcriptional regulator
MKTNFNYKKNKEGGVAYNVPALERGLMILELLGQHPKGLALVEMAKRLKLPANSTFRIALTLTRLGYISRCDNTKKYVLTRRLLSVGYSTVHEYNIVEKAMEFIRQFRDEVKETVALAVLLPEEVKGLVLAEATSSHPFGYRLEIGARFYLHCTGPGKALVAFLPEDELKKIIGRIVFTRYNENTITTKSGYMKELESVRKAGYALDREENINGCFCVSAPVFDEHSYPIAAIWATGPSNRPIASEYTAVGKMAREYALQISRHLTLTI